jgi:hypothetical protein
MTLPRRLAHYTVLFVLGTGFLAALYMVFVVHRVEGQGLGPMGSAASEVPLDFFVRRRLYALEAWLTFGFLSVYLALTELRPSSG